jgi:hypothetical protein
MTEPKIIVRILSPYFTYPPVPVEPDRLQEYLEAVAFSEDLAPRSRILVLIPLSETRHERVVLPVNERLRTFLSYLPIMGAAFVNKLYEWRVGDPELPDEPEDEDSGEADVFFG